MKKYYMPLLAAALLGMGAVATADDSISTPAVMTDTQLDTIVAGEIILFVDTPGALVGGTNGYQGIEYGRRGEKGKLAIFKVISPGKFVCVSINGNDWCDG